MRCLPDENIPHKLRRCLSGFETTTAQYAGFSGLKNGELLNAAEAAGFDVLVTGAKTIGCEQNLKDRRIGVVSLSAPHWRLIKDSIDTIAGAITRSSPGTLTRADVGRFVRKPTPESTDE